MDNWKKWLPNIAILIALFSLIAYYVFHEEDPRRLLRLLDWANGWYWLAGIVLVVLFISCESLIFRLMLHNAGFSPPKGHCLIYSFIGFFFSAITPAAGGGQPAQIYYMHKDGLNPGITSPILVVVTVCYKLVLVFYGLVALIVRPVEIVQANDFALWWAAVGLALNVIVISIFLLAIFRPVLLERLLHHIMRMARRFTKSQRLDRLEEKLERSLRSYKESTECIKNSPKLMAVVLAITIFQRSLLFAVTWLVLISFHITGYSLPTILIMQSMVSLGTDLLPLPGGSGAYEAMFLLLFEGICGEQFVLPVMIASRGISFYAQLLLCGAVTFLGIRRLGRTRRMCTE